MLKIKGYPDYYVSGSGGVFSQQISSRNPKGELKESKLVVDSRGYLVVGLTANGKRKSFSVHRLVAEAFIPNPENKSCINHIDGNKLNNRVDNLEHCTHSHNNKHAYDTGLKKPSGKSVQQCDSAGNVIAEFVSQMEASRVTGIRNSCIGKACKGKYKTAGGYIWRYKETST